MTGCVLCIISRAIRQGLIYRGIQNNRGGYALGSGFLPPESTYSRFARRKLSFRRGRGLPGRPFRTAQPASCRSYLGLSPCCAVAVHHTSLFDFEKALSFGGDCINFVGGSMVHRPSILRRAQDRTGSGRTIAGGTPALRNLVRLVHPPNWDSFRSGQVCCGMAWGALICESKALPRIASVIRRGS